MADRKLEWARKDVSRVVGALDPAHLHLQRVLQANAQNPAEDARPHWSSIQTCARSAIIDELVATCSAHMRAAQEILYFAGARSMYMPLHVCASAPHYSRARHRTKNRKGKKFVLVFFLQSAASREKKQTVIHFSSWYFCGRISEMLF